MTARVIENRQAVTARLDATQGDFMTETTPDDSHPFDRATRVTASAGRWRGETCDEYFAFVGPFGGATAATLLRAIMIQPERIGDPLTVTVNLCAPVANGAFDLDVRLVRATRSTQHWLVELTQGGGEVAAFATAVFAARRPSWTHQPPPFPARRRSRKWRSIPTPASPTGCGSIKFRFVEGLPRYGTTPLDVRGEHVLEDVAQRRRAAARRLPVAAVVLRHLLRTHLPCARHHRADRHGVDDHGVPRRRGRPGRGRHHERARRGRRQIFHKSFGDQTGELWAPSGRLLATTLAGRLLQGVAPLS